MNLSKLNYFSLLLAYYLLFTFSCSNPQQMKEQEEAVTQEKSTFDITQIQTEVKDNSVIIGDQTWMGENLAVETFRNGDPIAAIQTNPQWQTLGAEGDAVFGHFMNDPTYSAKYGYIYNWYTIADERGVCPTGWRIPTQNDWEQLIDYLGGTEQAGMFLKKDTDWGAGGNGTNASGFAAMPGGFRGYDGISYSAGYMGRFWTSSEHSEYFAYGFDMNYDQNSVNQSRGYKLDGFSVRCIKE